MKHLLTLSFIAATFLACSTTILTPATGPGTEYPCGIDGIVCTDMAGAPNHKCCDRYETCGGSKYSVGCPADMCCYIGGDDMVGAHKAHPQVSEHR